MEDQIMQENGQNNKNNKKNIIILIIIGVIAIAALAIVIGKSLVKEKRSNEQVIVDSFVNTAFLNSVESTSDISIEELVLDESIPDSELISNLIKDFNIQTNYRYDGNNDQMEIYIDLMMGSISMLNAYLYVSEEIVGIDIPMLYDKPLYVSTEDAEELYGLDFKRTSEDMKKIREHIKNKEYESINEFDAVQYDKLAVAFVQSILDENIDREKIELNNNKIECTKYTLNSDIEQWLVFFGEILDVMRNDEKLIQSQAGNEDSSIAIIGGADGPTAIYNSNDINQIKEYIDMTMNTVLYINDDILRKSENKIDFTINGITDSPIKFVLNLESVIEKANETVEIKGLNMDTAINVSDLSPEEQTELLNTIQSNITQYIGENGMFDF